MTNPDTAEAKIREILDKHAEYYIRETVKFFQHKGESPALSKDNPGDLESLQQLKGLLVDAKLDSKLQKAIDMSGNEFAMGYSDSSCTWHFQYGIRGAGNMVSGCGERYECNEPGEVEEALDEFIAALQQTRQEEVKG